MWTVTQTRSALADGLTNILYEVSADEDIANFWTRGNSGEELTKYGQPEFVAEIYGLLTEFKC